MMEKAMQKAISNVNKIKEDICKNYEEMGKYYKQELDQRDRVINEKDQIIAELLVERNHYKRWYENHRERMDGGS